jgi:hypothetical protein
MPVTIRLPVPMAKAPPARERRRVSMGVILADDRCFEGRFQNFNDH